MLFFYLILTVYGSDSLTPLVNHVTSHDAVLRSKASKVANNKTQFSSFIESIKANPTQFIAETQQFDTEGIRYIISLLKGLKIESEVAEDRLVTALNDANTVLNDANAALAGANRDVKDANLSMQIAKETTLGVLLWLKHMGADKEQKLSDAEIVLESKKADHYEKQGAKDFVQKDHDSTVPRLNDEQQVLSDVITKLEETIGIYLSLDLNYRSDSFTPLVNHVTSHDAVLRSKASKVAKNKTQFSIFIESIKANPTQFIAETQQFDAEGIRNIISLLKGLKIESEATEDRLVTALNDANTALNDANAALAAANRDVKDANLSVQNEKGNTLIFQQVFEQNEANKVQELSDAEIMLESKKADHYEKQGAKDVVQKVHDSTVPRLNDEQQVLSKVITMLEETID